MRATASALPPLATGVSLPLLMLSMLVLMVGSGEVGPSSTPQSGWYLLGRLTCGQRTHAHTEAGRQAGTLAGRQAGALAGKQAGRQEVGPAGGQTDMCGGRLHEAGARRQGSCQLNADRHAKHTSGRESRNQPASQPASQIRGAAHLRRFGQKAGNQGSEMACTSCHLAAAGVTAGSQHSTASRWIASWKWSQCMDKLVSCCCCLSNHPHKYNHTVLLCQTCTQPDTFNMPLSDKLCFSALPVDAAKRPGGWLLSSSHWKANHSPKGQNHHTL